MSAFRELPPEGGSHMTNVFKSHSVRRLVPSKRAFGSLRGLPPSRCAQDQGQDQDQGQGQGQVGRTWSLSGSQPSRPASIRRSGRCASTLPGGAGGCRFLFFIVFFDSLRAFVALVYGFG